MAAPATAHDEVAKIIRQMDDEFTAHVRSSDMDALVAAFYAPDATLMPPGNPAQHGRAARQIVSVAAAHEGDHRDRHGLIEISGLDNAGDGLEGHVEAIDRRRDQTDIFARGDDLRIADVGTRFRRAGSARAAQADRL